MKNYDHFEDNSNAVVLQRLEYIFFQTLSLYLPILISLMSNKWNQFNFLRFWKYRIKKCVKEMNICNTLSYDALRKYFKTIIL